MYAYTVWKMYEHFLSNTYSNKKYLTKKLLLLNNLGDVVIALY